MKITKDDPRLMDYVLNELETGEHAAVEAALKLEENAEAREEVAALRQVVDLSTEALAEESVAATLEPGQRAEVLREVEQGEAPAKKTFFLFRPAFALAACALLGVGLTVIGVNRMGAIDSSSVRSLQAKNMNAELEAQMEALGYFGDTSKDLPGSGNTPPALMEQRTRLNPDAEFTEDVKLFIEEKKGFPAGADPSGIKPWRLQVPELEEMVMSPAEEAKDEWDDLEVGSISGQQAVAERPQADAARASKSAPVAARGYRGGGRGNAFGKGKAPEVAAAPAPPTYSFDINGDGSPEEIPYKSVPTQQHMTSRVITDGDSGNLQNAEIGGEIRVRGDAYGQSGINKALPKTDRNVVAFWEQRTRLNQQADGLPELKEQLEYLGYLGDSQPSRDYYFEYPRQSGEAYLPIEEKAFASVLQKPLSTFSIDVDTGAYSNVRRFIEGGHLPDPNAVRIEELINYFDYVPSAPVGDVPFGVGVEVAPCPWQPEHWLSKVVVSGKEVDAEERGDANLVFLLDVSGSMKDSNKLPLVQESMKALLNELRPTDRVALVTYAGSSQVVLNSTAVGEGRKIRNAINKLNAGGGTNGSGGIEAAYRIAKANFVDGGINRVILATDGDFNIGVTHHGGLMGLITEHAKSNVFLTALGFGMGNYKDGTLEQLADKGNGNYAYIDGIAEARKVLVDELSGTMITIAKDVKIQVEFNPQHIGHYRLIGYENRALKARDFNDDTKDAGEIGAGHQVTALYELVPAGQSPQPGVDALKYQATESDVRPERELSDELMNVKLRYKDPEGSVSAKIEVPVKRDAVTRKASADFKFAAAVAGYGLVLRNSQYRGNASLDGVAALAEAGKHLGGSMSRRMMKEVDDMEDARQDFIDLVVTTKTLTQR